MASGWTESGIDWDNLSTQSPRDVIRELYIAVNERNYWIQYFATGGYNTIDSLDPIDYDVSQRRRTKEQIDYIVPIISKWLQSDSDYRNSGSNPAFISNLYGGCFIDYNGGSDYSFDGYGREADLGYSVYRSYMGQEELSLGYKTYSADEGSNTELLTGSSFSFIRDYRLGKSFRFTHEMMKAVYDVLNKLNYVRCAVTTRSVGYNVFNGQSFEAYYLNTYFSDNNGSYAGGFIQGSLGELFPSFNSARSYLYNNKYGRNTGIDGADVFAFNGVNIDGGGPGTNWSGGTINPSRNSFLRFQNIGHNGQIFRTSDFGLKSLTYGISHKADVIGAVGERVIDYSDYTLASRPSGHSIIDNSISTLTNANNNDEDIDLNYQGEYWNMSYGNIVDGDIPSSVENTTPANNKIQGRFITHYLPLIDFNKEGFLKYYTEATN
jgi:hypothetical protein